MTPTLAILAGGASSRMGTPKSHLTLRGKPILHYLLDRLAWPGPTLLVTAPDDPQPPGHDRFTTTVADPVAHEGPLRGLLTGLQACTTDTLLLLPVDMPAIGRAHLDWLVASLAAHPNALALLPIRRVAGQDQIEPFPSIYRRDAAARVAEHLSSGSRSLHSLLRLPRFTTLPAPRDWPAETWLNLNHPQDLDRFLDD